MKIAIMGSGAVGAYVGARLQAAGADITYIARGSHLQAMQANGLQIQMPDKDLLLPQVKATDDPASVGHVDLVFFSVKLTDTVTAAQALTPLINSQTRVLTLQNGIDSVSMISKELPQAKVRGGVIYVSAVIDKPGVIKSPGGFHRVVADKAGNDPVMAELGAWAAKCTALEVALVDDIERIIWEKFMGLAAFSGCTSLLRARIGEIFSHPESTAFLQQLITESVAVANASGQTVRTGMAEEYMKTLMAAPPSFRSSMSEDLERGKALELPWLSGRVHQLGVQLGVPTPAHTAVYRGLVLKAQGLQ
jgi:2-dehydropantoate 2-reductase